MKAINETEEMKYIWKWSNEIMKIEEINIMTEI